MLIIYFATDVLLYMSRNVESNVHYSVLQILHVTLNEWDN